MKKLTEIIATGILSAGMLVGLAGCETYGQQAVTGTLMGAAFEDSASKKGISSETRNARLLAARTAYSIAQQKARLAEAEAGKSDVNVNVNVNNQPQVQSQARGDYLPEYNLSQIESAFYVRDHYSTKPAIKTIFTYNWYKDLNKNNANDFNDFGGIKRNFRKGENIGWAVVVCNHVHGYPWTKSLLETKEPNTVSLELEVYNTLDMELIYTKSEKWVVNEGVKGHVFGYTNAFNDFPAGTYLINAVMKDSIPKKNRQWGAQTKFRISGESKDE